MYGLKFFPTSPLIPPERGGGVDEKDEIFVPHLGNSLVSSGNEAFPGLGRQVKIDGPPLHVLFSYTGNFGSHCESVSVLCGTAAVTQQN